MTYIQLIPTNSLLRITVPVGTEGGGDPLVVGKAVDILASLLAFDCRVRPTLRPLSTCTDPHDDPPQSRTSILQDLTRARSRPHPVPHRRGLIVYEDAMEVLSTPTRHPHQALHDIVDLDLP